MSDCSVGLALAAGVVSGVVAFMCLVIFILAGKDGKE